MQARKNAFVAIGIDIMLYRPRTRRGISLRSLASSLAESMRHLSWYLSELFRGHIILPIPAIVTLIYGLSSVLMRPKPRLPRGTAADLYRLGWPEPALAQEFMATYLRFVALEDELYGLNPYDKRYIAFYLFARIYSSVISCLFHLLPPAAYISVYSGYIQHFIPCQNASLMGAPILVLGCTDCLYRIDDTCVPRQFVHLDNVLTTPWIFDQQIVSQGRHILRQRIGGLLDSAIQYMPSSPFTASDSSLFWSVPGVAESLYEYRPRQAAGNDGDGFVVVFMHEFQDWHHNGVLPPFASSYYEWLFITVKYLIERRLPFAIKIHPAIVSSPGRYHQTVRALCRMKLALDSSLPISTASTTLELNEMGMGLGLTVRGTIGLELAYLRLRFICAGIPPYGSLFPRRTELDLCNYLNRLSNFRHEPEVSLEESAAAAYYIGLQNEMLAQPVIRLEKKALNTSPAVDFIQAKKYL